MIELRINGQRRFNYVNLYFFALPLSEKVFHSFLILKSFAIEVRRAA